MKILYTDIDYVLSLATETNNKLTKWGYVGRLNRKAVKVYNDILDKTGAEIVISSDWKHHWTLEQLQEIFIDFAKIIKVPIDITPTLWNVKYKSLQQLEECRANEILLHVEKHKPESWVAIDDLNLSPWISEEHFVHLTRINEGIKQTGKAEKVIKILNND